MSLYEKTINEFLDVASSSSPTPGGGNVSAVAATNAAAMVCMVANLTIGKKGYEDYQEQAKEVLENATKLREKLKELTQKDIDAFNAYMGVFRMPKNTDEEKEKRKTALQEAAKNATLVPLEISKTCLDILVEAEKLSKYGNKMAISDVGVAAYIAEACVKAAMYSVDINVPSIKDQEFVNNVLNERANIFTKAEELKVLTLANVNYCMAG
jgi:formiminotetrahydrofolate cyclodeaminase